jgi:hypothetical protein
LQNEHSIYRHVTNVWQPYTVLWSFFDQNAYFIYQYTPKNI